MTGAAGLWRCGEWERISLTFPYYYNEIKNFKRKFFNSGLLTKDGVIEPADHAEK